MATPEQALATQMANIEKKTGKNLVALKALLEATGLTKHGELRDWAKRELGLGHGDANTLVHLAFKTDGASAAEESGLSLDALVDEIYSGPKAALRGIHDQVMAALQPFGPFEIAPKKGYLSLRRKKQFAMIGPGTKTRVDLGINLKDAPGDDKVVAQPPGGMCSHKVGLTAVAEVDAHLVDWLRRAYDAAG